MALEGFFMILSSRLPFPYMVSVSLFEKYWSHSTKYGVADLLPIFAYR